MNCPECEQPMEIRHIGEVTIDECRKCRGIWFDPGQIDEVKDEVAPDLRWMDFELWRKKADFQLVSDPLYCPRCTNSVLTAIIEEESGIYVRFCPRCGGSWLSAVDFTRIIDALEAELDERTASDFFKESFKQAGELLTGKGEPISQWKDLKAVLRLLKFRIFIENPKLNAVMQGLQKTLPL